jgi:hypothetical protein
MDQRAEDLLAHRIGWLRALHLWFHAAHHVIKGTSYSGDHGILYDRIYTAIQDEVDGAVEKAIGLTRNVGLACPRLLTSTALEILERYPSPVDLEAVEIARVGLRLERNYIDVVTDMFEELEQADMLSLGLNDQLAASANAHETFLYLLQQRAYRCQPEPKEE